MTAMPLPSLHLPAWPAGERALDRIRDFCPAGQTAVVIGGRKGTAAIRARLEKAAAGRVSLLGFLWYGGEASEENVSALREQDMVRQADMIFAVGGGKALDTCKVLGMRLQKPVYAFPTIASTCAACTAVAILYHPDGNFAGPCFLPAPPVHTFIDTAVISAAPPRYLWAGLGDTYAKFFESSVSSRGDSLTYCQDLGVSVSRSCLDPLLRYGEKAFLDHRNKTVSEELTQVIMTIIVTTAVASILLTADRRIDYNTGLAHAVFYALTAFPEFHMERDHLHGGVVGFGVLILLLADGQEDMFRTMYTFNRSVGLPTRLEHIGLTEKDLEKALPRVVSMPDIAHNPYPVTLEMLSGAFRRLQEFTPD